MTRIAHPIFAFCMTGLLLSACARTEPVLDEALPAEPSLSVEKPTLRPDGAFENTQAEKLGQGRAIAENICSACYSIETDGPSPHPDAIAFRDLSKQYPVESLAEPLGEGIMVGHPDMPVFEFEPDHIDSLLAYLESIQSPHAL